MSTVEKRKKIAIIGAGFSGLSAAAYAAQSGHDVQIFEQHDRAGGRARQFTTDQGFVFDMGPSWYWMPDIIEQFFQDFHCQSSDFFELIRLDPQFEMVFAEENWRIPESLADLRQLVEQVEPGAGDTFDDFFRSAKTKYEIGMREFVNRPCHHWGEFMSPKIASHALKLDLLTNFRAYVRKYFKHPKLQTLMEFPVIFLGASPQKIPALYSLMNYGGYALGTWYPKGGFYQLVLAMQQVAEKQGARFHFNTKVEAFHIEGKSVKSLRINGESHDFDAIISAADYHHTESLLPDAARNYNAAYWQSRTLAPSCLIYYIGLDEILSGLQHHTLFFENDLDQHIHSIYEDKAWPEHPLFYVCCPSKTDDGVAPQGKENLFLLMPVAPGISDDESLRERYLREMLSRIEKHTQSENLASKIIFKRSYCVRDFQTDYNAYQGNAYGLANTLKQTAVWKPKIKNKHLTNLLYAGQLTVPGPGVPPSIISGRIAAGEIENLKIKSHEKTIR